VSAQEYLARSQNTGRFTSNINAEERVSVQQVGPNEGALKPVWVRSMLLLMRIVRVEGKDYVQGCWLDWPQIQTALLADVKDRLPLARLAPVTSVTEAEPTRALASLPVKLLPGEAPPPAKDGLSPIRLSLGVAWVCILLAGSVGAFVLAKAISLSERRAAFVSAVTHELRTPLTTFRMYTELLAGGMVADEAKRQQYFDTLRTESERLGRLVENVLSYARLENGRHAASLETVALRDLMARLEPRLSGRAGEAGLRLCIVPEGAWEQTVSVDVSVVEQILFNLTDNACKYAAAALDKRIEVHAERSGDGAILRVCDHGPGIGEKESRRLFEPFRKSARDAAHSAPGVGLGLALSRRLARDLGGDLRLLLRTGDGACFELTLPSRKMDAGR
jgi:signal transduction histidine kinase